MRVDPMTDFTPQAQPDPDARPGHEGDDIRYRGLVLFGVALAATCALTMLIVYAAMQGFKAEETADGVTTRALVGEVQGDFPQPRLQSNYTYDMVEFRKREARALASYGWADRKAGIAQIPVARAIDVLAKSGLPKGKGTPPAEKAPEGADARPAPNDAGASTKDTKPAGHEPAKKD
jgi:hypothetical protein